MEKTVQITIASTQFQVTESAYDLLRSYLDRLKAHFGTSPDAAEIMQDIESRIAEKFLDAKHKLVTEHAVTSVIAAIGEASEFAADDESAEAETVAAPKTASLRKLYRDTDGGTIAGVSAGIGAYFNINPNFVRLAFLASMLFGGAGIFIYILLWIIVPEAKTASQKLEMRGSAVTLESIAQVVKDRVEETKRSGIIEIVIGFIGDIIRGAWRILTTKILPAFGSVIGALMSIGSFFAIIGTSVLLGIILLNWNASWNDIPHKEAISPFYLKAALSVGYAAILIPLVFIFSLGFRWMTRRTVLPTAVGFGLVGVWALTLVGSGVLATKIIGDYVAYTSNHPDYAQTIDEHPLAKFTALSVNDVPVTLKEGDAYSIRIEGHAIDMQNVLVTEENGVVSVSRVEHSSEACLFCNTSTPSVTITAPSVESVTVQSGRLSFSEFNTDSLTLTVDRANIYGDITARDLTITSRSAPVRLDLAVDTVALDIESGWITLEGSAKVAQIKTRDSSVNAENIRITDASVDARSSFVNLDVTGELTIQNETDSHIENAGTDAGVSKDENES